MPNIDTQAELALFAGTTLGEWETANKSVRVAGTQRHYTWGAGAPNGPQGGVCNCLGQKRVDGADEQAKRNAAFIARAHNIYPALLREIDELREYKRTHETEGTIGA